MDRWSRQWCRHPCLRAVCLLWSGQCGGGRHTGQTTAAAATCCPGPGVTRGPPALSAPRRQDPGGRCWRLPCVAAGRGGEPWCEKRWQQPPPWGPPSAVPCCCALGPSTPVPQYPPPVSVQSVSAVDMGGRNGGTPDMCVRTRGCRGLAGELGCCVHLVLPVGSGPGA